MQDNLNNKSINEIDNIVQTYIDKLINTIIRRFHFNIFIRERNQPGRLSDLSAAEKNELADLLKTYLGQIESYVVQADSAKRNSLLEGLKSNMGLDSVDSIVNISGLYHSPADLQYVKENLGVLAPEQAHYLIQSSILKKFTELKQTTSAEIVSQYMSTIPVVDGRDTREIAVQQLRQTTVPGIDFPYLETVAAAFTTFISPLLPDSAGLDRAERIIGRAHGVILDLGTLAVTTTCLFVWSVRNQVVNPVPTYVLVPFVALGFFYHGRRVSQALTMPRTILPMWRSDPQAALNIRRLESQNAQRQAILFVGSTFAFFVMDYLITALTDDPVIARRVNIAVLATSICLSLWQHLTTYLEVENSLASSEQTDNLQPHQPS